MTSLWDMAALVRMPAKPSEKAATKELTALSAKIVSASTLCTSKPKKWEGTVGRPEIQRFVGALHGKRAKEGVFITTGSFSAEAVAYVDHIDPKIVLIDGRRLAELMIDFDVGVNTAATYHLKRVDSDYFDDSGSV